MPSAPDMHIALTRAEAETLRAIVEHGFRNSQLAEHFGVSEAAVASRLHRLYERVELHGRVEAAVWAARHMDCCVEKVAL